MLERDVASIPATESGSVAPSHSDPANLPAEPRPADAPPVTIETRQSRWESRRQLAWHRAETERLRVLVDFLARPIHAHGGTEPDPDIVTAYNLAVESALQEIRRASQPR